MAGPGLAVAVLLGAPSHVLSAWLALLSVQLAFQHANLDYRVGPLRRWLGVAEVHRWHHKREYENAQVNFGEFAGGAGAAQIQPGVAHGKSDAEVDKAAQAYSKQHKVDYSEALRAVTANFTTTV